MDRLPLLFLAIAVTLSGLPVAAADAADDADAWSRPVNGLQTRLGFTRKETVNGTPIITTYLELRNVSDRGKVMELPLDGEDVAFTFAVTDSAGKPVSPDLGPYDEVRAEVGVVRLPFDSLLRVNIAHRGAGVPKGQAAHLDLGPLAIWDFKQGDRQTYYLGAKFTVKKRDDGRWSGTLTIPRAKLPTAGK